MGLPSAVFARAALLAALLLISSPNRLAPDTTRSSPSTWTSAEDARLQAHFRDVLEVLARRDVSALPPDARHTRELLIEELRAYAARGVFPRNEGHSGERTPVFVDRHGTRCAMAHLIERSGHAALVTRVAAHANLATIHALASDPELARWLQRSGLSVAEAALIQPAYTPHDDGTDHRENHRPDDGLMQASTMTTAFLGGSAILMNLNTRRPAHERRQIATLGIIAGTAGIGVGIADWSSDGHLRGSGYFQLVAGTCSVTMSLMSLANIGKSGRAGSGPQSLATPLRRTSWSLVPGQAGEPQLAVTRRF